MNLLGGPAAFTDLEASKEDRFVFAFFFRAAPAANGSSQAGMFIAALLEADPC